MCLLEGRYNALSSILFEAKSVEFLPFTFSAKAIHMEDLVKIPFCLLLVRLRTPQRCLRITESLASTGGIYKWYYVSYTATMLDKNTNLQRNRRLDESCQGSASMRPGYL